MNSTAIFKPCNIFIYTHTHTHTHIIQNSCIILMKGFYLPHMLTTVFCIL